MLANISINEHKVPLSLKRGYKDILEYKQKFTYEPEPESVRVEYDVAGESISLVLEPEPWYRGMVRYYASKHCYVEGKLIHVYACLIWGSSRRGDGCGYMFTVSLNDKPKPQPAKVKAG